MNKKDNRLTFSVSAALIAGIALIYTFIRYSEYLFAIIGVSALFLIAVHVLTQNLVAFSMMRSKSLNVHMKEYIDDLSAQLESMNAAQSQIGKANYIYIRQAAQSLASLDNNYTESQSMLAKNFASLSSMQNKATKINIKYDQDNTTRVIAAVKEMRNQLNETLITGFDHTQPNNADIIAILTEIVNYLKAQAGSGLNQGMEIQLNNVANQLQNISNSIQHVQMPPQNNIPNMTYAMAMNHSPVDQVPIQANMATSSVDMTTDRVSEATTQVAMNTAQSVSISETTSSFEPDMNNRMAVDTLTPDMADGSFDSVLSSLTADETDHETSNVLPEEVLIHSPLPNETMENPDGTVSDTTMENQEFLESENAAPFVPTFTVVENSTEDYVSSTQEPASASESESTPESKPAIEASTPIVADPADANKMLSVNQPASAPEPESGPEPESTPEFKSASESVAPIAADPADANKMLSPDEIAALFAASAPITSSEPQPAPETSPKSETASDPITPIAADPADANKMLSPDEIAALFASMG